MTTAARAPEQEARPIELSNFGCLASRIIHPEEYPDDANGDQNPFVVVPVCLADSLRGPDLRGFLRAPEVQTLRRRVEGVKVGALAHADDAEFIDDTDQASGDLEDARAL